MSYVKNYNVGQIKLDLPTPNYFHELPLMSFADVYGTVNLSLIFNYGMSVESGNPYNISGGYKLNLQKRIIMDSNGLPTKFEDENGMSVTLKRSDTVYAFRDESQRILRKVGTTYELENPDFSKEAYDASGKITELRDKYGALVLSYAYDSSSRLISITYRGTKTITIAYNASNRLSSISYSGKSIAFSYTSSDVVISHYNGVAFTLRFLSENFTATASATENSTAISYATKIEKVGSDNVALKISDLIGGDVVEEMTYTFPELIVDLPATTLRYANKYNQVEMTDKNNVIRRTQYQNGKFFCSYEIDDNGNYVENESAIFSNVDNVKNCKARGVFNDYTCLQMSCTNENNQTWEHDAYGYSDVVSGGYYIVTGWARSKNNYNHSLICISGGGGVIDFQFYSDILPHGQWKYFAYMFQSNANTIYVFPDNTATLELKDLRITYKPVTNVEDKYGSRALLSEDVLIYHGNGSTEYIPIDQATFTCGDEDISDYGDVHLADVLKYKLNKNKNSHTNEIYYDKCTGVLLASSTDELKVTYNDSPLSLDNFYVGNRRYTTAGIVTTVYKDDDATAFLVCEQQSENGDVISSQKMNSTLDVISTTVDGITTTYTMENCLPKSESVTGLYTRTTAYGTDSSGNPTITVTDEFDSLTVYTLDPVWGNVKSVALPSGQVITDEFDSDGCAKVKRTFTSGGRFNVYEYFGGNLSRVQGNSVYYDFAYTKGDLTSIKKNNVLIEEHEITDTQVNSYYPSISGKIYSDLATFDKYGRLVSVDGVVENTYRNDATYEPETDSYVPWDGESISARLAESEDKITGKKTKFAYYDDKLVRAAEFSAAGTKLSEEIIEYDKAERLTNNTYNSNGKSTLDKREYVAAETAANPDNRVGKYEFFIDSSKKVLVNNGYDSYKRLSTKNITIGNPISNNSKTISKTFYYTNTRLRRINHTYNGSTIHNHCWDCDALLRTTNEYDTSVTGSVSSYGYDAYGQLTRENNALLDKTILYTYDNNGNITKAQKYNYTTGSVSGTPTTDNYTYSTSYPDRLTSFNSNSITYDNNGYVKTYDGWTYNWSKGRLSYMERITTSSSARLIINAINERYTFTYNAKGQRTRKKYTYLPGSLQEMDYMSSCTSDYEYDLIGRLLSETIEMKYSDGTIINKKLVFLYEESEIVGVIYTNENVTGTYYYDKNPRGDVIAILDNSGTKVVEYRYDAYGNCISYNSNNDDLARTNPIRYRSYYYDADTGLYYLNARYYNPQWRRFISPDSTDYLDPEAPNGLNLYAYCGNDPVNYVDPSGHSGIFLTVLISSLLGAAIAGGATLANQLIQNDFDFSKVNIWEVGASALAGFATGLAFGMGGVAGGIIKGSLHALTIAGKALTISQSVGLLLCSATITNFVAGVAGYAMHIAGSKTESFNIFKGISEGIGQTGKGLLSFFTGGMYVGAGFWNVGIGAKNTVSSIIVRSVSKFAVNFIPNYIFDNAF